MLVPGTTLDEKDRKVLRVLMRDPRIPIADIARETGLQRDTVLYRIRRFERKGIISKYHTILEPSALGLGMFMLVLIKMGPVAGEEVDPFVEDLKAHKNITHVARLIGKYDYFLQVAAEDIVAFDKVLTDIKNISPGVIADIEVSNIIDGLKTDDFSGLV